MEVRTSSHYSHSKQCTSNKSTAQSQAKVIANSRQHNYQDDQNLEAIHQGAVETLLIALNIKINKLI